MKRLTKRYNSVVTYIGTSNEYVTGQVAAEIIPQGVRDIMQRLAAYEDSTRSPEEVQAMNSLFDYVATENPTLEKTVRYFRRLRELAEADIAGRVVVLSNDYTDKDGEEALKKAMYICGYQNNGVTRYTADAIAEKLSREEAKRGG